MGKKLLITAFVLNLMLLIINISLFSFDPYGKMIDLFASSSILLGWISIIGIIISGLYLWKIHNGMTELKWLTIITLIISVINLAIWIWTLYKISNMRLY